MALLSRSSLPKPRSLLGWGVIAAATALVKEGFTDLTWGEVLRAPIQGILNAYNDPKTAGLSKAWNVAVEGTKLGLGIAVMAGATALAAAALPAVAATVAGSVAIAVGGLVVGGLASHFVIDPLLDRAKSQPPAVVAEPNPIPIPSQQATLYAALSDQHLAPTDGGNQSEPEPVHSRSATAPSPRTAQPSGARL